MGQFDALRGLSEEEVPERVDVNVNLRQVAYVCTALLNAQVFMEEIGASLGIPEALLRESNAKIRENVSALSTDVLKGVEGAVATQ